jgi:hypothetical protein
MLHGSLPRFAYSLLLTLFTINRRRSGRLRPLAAVDPARSLGFHVLLVHLASLQWTAGSGLAGSRWCWDVWAPQAMPRASRKGSPSPHRRRLSCASIPASQHVQYAISARFDLSLVLHVALPSVCISRQHHTWSSAHSPWSLRCRACVPLVCLWRHISTVVCLSRFGKGVDETGWSTVHGWRSTRSVPGRAPWRRVQWAGSTQGGKVPSG